MTGTPGAVLVARALYALESARLELENGNTLAAMISMATAVKILEGVEFG